MLGRIIDPCLAAALRARGEQGPPAPLCLETIQALDLTLEDVTIDEPFVYVELDRDAGWLVSCMSAVAAKHFGLGCH